MSEYSVTGKLRRLSKYSYDYIKNCSFDLVWDFVGVASAIDKDLKLIIDKSVDEEIGSWDYDTKIENGINLRDTPSPAQVVVINESQRQEYEAVLLGNGFVKMCSWQNFREGHTVHMYVAARKFVENEKEYTMDYYKRLE